MLCPYCVQSELSSLRLRFDRGGWNGCVEIGIGIGELYSILIRCPGIRRWFGTGFKSKQEVEAEERERLEEINEERRVKGKKPLQMPKKEGEAEEQ